MVNPAVEEILVHNQDALEELAWAIESSQGQFSLTLARCNYVSLREHLVTQIQKTCTVKLLVTPLRQTSQTLYTRLRALADATPVEALMVLGLETVDDLEEMLPAVNSVREEFRKHFPFPIVLWVTDAVHSKLVQLAPDFESWATTTAFTLPPNVLLAALQEASDRLFATLLTPDSNRSFRRLLENLDFGFLQRAEIEAAVRDLQQAGQLLTSDLQATLDFLRGLNAPTNQEALAYFQRSLESWQQLASHPTSHIPHPTPALIPGLILYFIGRTLYNICNENKYCQEDCEPPKQPLQECLRVFEQANRLDLVAKAITQLERVFEQLKAWEELAALAQKSLPLQQTYNDRARQAQDYRYLALTAIQRGQGADAKRYAEQALEIIEQVSEDQRYRGLYLLTLAEATKLTGQRDAALARLNEARSLGDQGIPRVYIAILEALRTYYIEQKDYLEAFRLKQERLSVEQQYQLRAFVGAGRLRAQRQDQEALQLNAVGTTDRSSLAAETLPIGMASWQRRRDVKQLIERIGRNDCKLIVIHGYSGVGKSSLISAGLVPTLQQKAIGLQPNVPVVVRKYTDWVEELERRLAEVLEEREQGGEGASKAGEAWKHRGREAETEIEPYTPHPTPHTLINQLRHNEQRNLRTILIFDQFEEFFFVYPTPALRRPFFAFLGQCLQLPLVKVVLPLREDYLYYLLECNRISEISTTGIDVLSRNVLYPLGNFAPDDARTIIQELTEQASFYLEPELVEALVTDLTDENGEVRPIELQIVGAQLQTEDIRDLEAYRKLRDAGKPAKEVLVGRYLAEVVADCGTDNQRAAELVLYLLTDENNTRPLKTLAELAEDMGEETTKLDFVLEILVRSGLVMLLPEVPADRYQLVHDYLVSYIRQQQGTTLLEELQIERAQRRLSEAKLDSIEKANQILAEAQQQARRDPRQRKSRILLQMLFTAIATAGCVLALRSIGWLGLLEISALDQALRSRPLESPDNRVVIVGINEEDIRLVGKYPIPDRELAKLLKTLQLYQPAAIGFDLFRDQTTDPNRAELAQVFRTSPNLIGIEADVGASTTLKVKPPPELPDTQVGLADIVVDSDGKLRRCLLASKVSSGQVKYSLSLLLAAHYLKAKGITLQHGTRASEPIHFGSITLPRFRAYTGGYVQAKAGGNQILLNFRSHPHPFRVVSMTQVLKGQVQPEWLRGQIVLVGVTAPNSLNDTLTTAAIKGSLLTDVFGASEDYKLLYGVENHAHSISQIVSGVLDGRPFLQTWYALYEWLWILGWSLVGTLVGWRALSLHWFLLNTLFLTAALITIFYLAIVQGWWLPLIPPFLAMIGGMFIALSVVKNKVIQLDRLRDYATLDVLLKAYPKDPVVSRLAIEFLIRLTGSKELSDKLSQFLSEQDRA